MKKTLILGATTNPERYAYLAALRLLKYGHEIVPIGLKEGDIEGHRILTGQPESTDVDTITLYLNPTRQIPYYDYIFSLQPKRIIFNPGTENNELERLAKEKGIETVEGCTLVMLSTGQF